MNEQNYHKFDLCISDLLMFVDRKEKVTHINSDKVIGLKIRATLSTNQMQSAFVTRVFPPFRWVFIVSLPDKKILQWLSSQWLQEI